MHVLALFTPLLTAATALACADHDYPSLLRLTKREDASPPTSSTPITTTGTNGTTLPWAYEASYDWGRLSESYVLCQDGTTQSPIPLRLDQGLSLQHILNFKTYNSNNSGIFRNWGYGPAMTLAHDEGDYTTLPSFEFEENGVNETVYMTGWHIHAPADHTVQGARSKAELHFVHVNEQGQPRAVLAFRVDPGNAPSRFFGNLPDLISYRQVNVTMEMDNFNPSLVLDEVNRFAEFWTYRGMFQTYSGNVSG
jgi:carbonic anhydrase